jgi:hypothetical protein
MLQLLKLVKMNLGLEETSRHTRIETPLLGRLDRPEGAVRLPPLEERHLLFSCILPWRLMLEHWKTNKCSLSHLEVHLVKYRVVVVEFLNQKPSSLPSSSWRDASTSSSSSSLSSHLAFTKVSTGNVQMRWASRQIFLVLNIRSYKSLRKNYNETQNLKALFGMQE